VISVNRNFACVGISMDAQSATEITREKDVRTALCHATDMTEAQCVPLTPLADALGGLPVARGGGSRGLLRTLGY